MSLQSMRANMRIISLVYSHFHLIVLQSYYNIPDQCACEDGICCCYEDSGVLTEATSEHTHEAIAINVGQEQHKHTCLQTAPYLQVLPTHMQESLSASLASLCSTCKHNYLEQYFEIITASADTTSLREQNRSPCDAGCPSLCEVDVIENADKQMEADPQHKQNQMHFSLQDALNYISQGGGDLSTTNSARVVSLCSTCKLQLQKDKPEELPTGSCLCSPDLSTDPMYANTPSHALAPCSKQHLQSVRTNSNDSGNVRDLESPDIGCLTTVHTNFDISHIQTEYDCRCSTPGSVISSSTAGYLKFDL